MKKLTPSQENYLEWIYRFSLEGDVRIRDLAKKLGVKVPSVSRAVSRIKNIGLVRHNAYGKIELTEEGERVGKGIVRRDDCLMRLLVDVLNMDPAEADPEVHRLEHMLGDEVLSRLEVLVDFATSSDAWLRRLAFRIQSITSSKEITYGYRVGGAVVHAGSTKKRNEGRNN